LTLVVFGIYKNTFKSSWELFKRVFKGLFLGTLLSIAFVYVFRHECGTFPTTIFIASFFINLVLIFKFNQLILKSYDRIKKKIVVIGEGDTGDVIIGRADITRIRVDDVKELADHRDINEIIICDMPKEKDMGFIIYFAQNLKIDMIFSPACYVKMMPERINGTNSNHPLATFVSRKRDIEEFLMRSLDVIGSLIILVLSMPVTIIVALAIKFTLKGSVIYKQQRVGKDGKLFTLYKFKTMRDDVGKETETKLVEKNDPRVTKVGRILRKTYLNEFPQLINVLCGDMSLVGPRPELPDNVKNHKVLKEIRLAVRPGLTGLAQVVNVKNAYELHPKHKIKYDYLYIQRRSFVLNFYILLKTIPVVLLRKGQ
jgi:lipopolysaccharide/colanic/teichoic acid biosynthesis glycosyltransferase